MPKMPTSATIPLPKISFAKRKARSQVFRVATLDGRVVKREIIIGNHCADEVGSGRAFLVDSENQYLNEDNMWVQVVGETSAFPSATIVKRNTADQEAIIEKAYHDTKQETKLIQFFKITKNAKDELIKWCLGIPTIGIIIVYAIYSMGH
jgi:hypothetical protein